jgi:hypothetical protein
VDRQELMALRDVLDVLLKLPDSMHGQIVRWLTPEAPKPNGHDPHPPPVLTSPRRARVRKPTSAKTA